MRPKFTNKKTNNKNTMQQKEQPGLEQLIKRLRILISGYPSEKANVVNMKRAYSNVLGMAKEILADEAGKEQAPTEEKYIYFTAVYIGTNSNQGFETGTCYKLMMPKFGGTQVCNDKGNMYNYNSISAFLHDWKDISALTEDKDRY